jgi:hypothetical protein
MFPKIDLEFVRARATFTSPTVTSRPGFWHDPCYCMARAKKAGTPLA